MAVELATKFEKYTDEQFSTESKKSLLTNQDFDWTGAHTIKVYKITTAPMNDYDRDGTGTNWSRYGAVDGLDATTEELTLKRDRSFTFATDALDEEETLQQLESAAALARQIREVVTPMWTAIPTARCVAEQGTSRLPWRCLPRTSIQRSLKRMKP